MSYMYTSWYGNVLRRERERERVLKTQIRFTVKYVFLYCNDNSTVSEEIRCMYSK